MPCPYPLRPLRPLRLCGRDESRPYVFESKGDRPVAPTYFLRSLRLNFYFISSLPWGNHTRR